MKRAWPFVMLVLSACGGWDELAEQSRQERCAREPQECDAGIVTVDAGRDDAGADAGADAGVDAGTDAGTQDAGSDAGLDAGTEVDAGLDAGSEDGGTEDAGIRSQPCTLNSHCSPGELCHPTARVCAKTCLSAGPGCSSCDLPPGYNHGPRFCSCGLGDCAVGDVCSGFDKVCMPSCASGTCPGARTCGGGGQCLSPDGCNFGECAAGLACDSRTLLCSSMACDAGSPQPAGCSHNTFCGANSFCTEPPRPTCSNFASSASWYPGSTGPVIFAITPTAPVAANCSGGIPFSVILSAYSSAGWPATKSGLMLDYVNQAGGRISASSLLMPSEYWPDGGVVSMRLTLCPSTSTPFNAGFQFDGGNPFCVLLDGGF